LVARNLNATQATLAAAIMELLLYLGKPYINSHPKVIQKLAWETSWRFPPTGLRDNVVGVCLKT
jgi:hypothetical protein